jgi:hypothetical protein
LQSAAAAEGGPEETHPVFEGFKDPSDPNIRIAGLVLDPAAGYCFNKVWFDPHAPSWEVNIFSKLLPAGPGSLPVRCLEVGLWEGRSTCYTLLKLASHPESKMVCVDPFEKLYVQFGENRVAWLRNVAAAGGVGAAAAMLVRVPGEAVAEGGVRAAAGVVHQGLGDGNDGGGEAQGKGAVAAASEGNLTSAAGAVGRAPLCAAHAPEGCDKQGVEAGGDDWGSAAAEETGCAAAASAASTAADGSGTGPLFKSLSAVAVKALYSAAVSGAGKVQLMHESSASALPKLLLKAQQQQQMDGPSCESAALAAPASCTESSSTARDSTTAAEASSSPLPAPAGLIEHVAKNPSASGDHASAGAAGVDSTALQKAEAKAEAVSWAGDLRFEAAGNFLLPFDFIYIDGSHMRVDVLLDAVLAWQLLKPGGFMVLDDYEWNEYRDNMVCHPKVRFA